MKLPSELRGLVKDSVGILGQVIQERLGPKAFAEIESTRKKMASLRGAGDAKAHRILQDRFSMLQKFNKQERLEFARSFTLMLEMKNACENAYRSHRLSQQAKSEIKDVPDSIIYVLTAHPTEARAPFNIWVFHEITRILGRALRNKDSKLGKADRAELHHWIQVAWNTGVVRSEKPQVLDEAEHIYSTLLRDETLKPLLAASQDLTSIYIRSWVGGDKDGHPGVDEKTFQDSLQLSRSYICKYALGKLDEVYSSARAMNAKQLWTQCNVLQKALSNILDLNENDGKHLVHVKTALKDLSKIYLEYVGSAHPALIEIKALIRMFPGLVVPIEFRESSDVLMSNPANREDLAIARMIKKLAEISKGADPRWYVRGFIISMTESFEHIQAAANLVKHYLGDIRIPIVPLFEQANALDQATVIVKKVLNTAEFRHALTHYWSGFLEVMLGYSDSSKESGVLASRLKIAQTMHALDSLCAKENVLPLFFQGSGGSTDRGGGTIQEQTAWWSKGALKNYKVTLQGEMVERSFASPEITRGQLEKIAQNAGHWKHNRKWKSAPGVSPFASKVAEHYKRKVHELDFLKAVEVATPYSFLDVIKIGSRPQKRASQVSVEGLRAIPWVLCWTQTRVLFPTWWGVGSAWKETTASDRAELKSAYKNDPLFATFVRAIGFTLTKVELPIFRMYLEQSNMENATAFWKEFKKEYDLAIHFTQTIMANKKLLGARPWLQESITLRSPMIHPLNLLQIIAMQNKEDELLRLSVAGISSGMMNTG